MQKVDDILAMGRRGLRTLPGTLLFGPTGARLWADYLEDRPGFGGRLDFIHKINIPLLFGFADDIAAPPRSSEVSWHPSHMRARSRIGACELDEIKFITWDDCAVSLTKWHNTGSKPQIVKFEVDPSWVASIASGESRGERDIPAHGFRLRMLIRCSQPELCGGLTLKPGETIECVTVAALGTSETDDWTALSERTRPFMQSVSPDDLLTRQQQAYQAWFDETPDFRCSSELLERTWVYRWFLLRHNLARPGLGSMPRQIMYEGRSHKMGKAPWAPDGWEFSKHIPLSTPMHLMECRWHKDTSLGNDIATSLPGCIGEDGEFYSRTLTRRYHHYANFSGWAVYQLALVHGISDDIRAVLPTLKRQVEADIELRTNGDDALPIQQDHRLTGKEYQPSYWFFHGFPDDPNDKSTYTPLKRVDRAIYQHLNAQGVARLCRLLGDKDADTFTAIAARIADSVLKKQWDAETGFFYDLHPTTDEKAMVRNVVGFYPYWAGLTGTKHLQGLEEALGADHFGTPWPVPSVSRDCPVFQPAGSWKGHYLKGRNGCMWDGPTWPYTNSITLDAIANASKSDEHSLDRSFADIFWKYVLMHYHQHDGKNAYLVEHYDSLTGEPISDEADYNHSYLIDIIIRQVIGFDVDADGTLTLDPVDIGLEWFDLNHLKVRGHDVQITWPLGDKLSLKVDGSIVAERQGLGKLIWKGITSLPA